MTLFPHSCNLNHISLSPAAPLRLIGRSCLPAPPASWFSASRTRTCRSSTSRSQKTWSYWAATPRTSTLCWLPSKTHARLGFWTRTRTKYQTQKSRQQQANLTRQLCWPASLSPWFRALRCSACWLAPSSFSCSMWRLRYPFSWKPQASSWRTGWWSKEKAEHDRTNFKQCFCLFINYAISCFLLKLWF